MPLTGSDKAYKNARSGVARSGASRSGYFTPVAVAITVDGVDQTNCIVRESLYITLNLNDTPDTARFSLKPSCSPTLVNKDTVIIGLGTSANRIFAGQIDRFNVRRQPGPGGLIPFPTVECIDWTRLFNRRRVTTAYANESASSIAQDLLDHWTSGFTGNAIEAGLPTIDSFQLTNETVTQAFRRLVTLMGGGGFYVDAYLDVHLFGPAGDTSLSAPASLTNTRSTLLALTHEYDATQIRNAPIVEGAQTTCPILIPAGANLNTSAGIPVTDGWLFNPTTNVNGNYIRLGNVTGEYDAAVQVVGPPGPVTLTADLDPGDTTAAVDANGAFAIGTSVWAYAPDNDVIWFSCSANVGTPTVLDSIPASGFGSVPITVPAGTDLYIWHQVANIQLDTDSGLVEFDIETGTPIVVRMQAHDTAEQTALAAIEGGDGVHEDIITDGRLNFAGAETRAEAESVLVSETDGILSAQWTTEDMNARPGALQSIAITGTNGVSDAVIITRVDLTFPAATTVPTRRCQGATLKLADLTELLTDAHRARFESENQ